MNKNIYFKIFIIIMCIYLSTDILSNITKSFTYMSIQNEIKNFKIYHKFCSNNIK